MAKSIAKKSAKSTSKKATNGQKVHKPNALHEKLVKLFARPNGATITEIAAAGFKYPAVQALKIAERRGFKTSSKKPGPRELNRYYAKRAGG
jgi:hypothetical protein